MHSPWRRMHVFLFLSSVFSLGIDDLMLHPTCYNVVTRLREANLRNLENTKRRLRETPTTLNKRKEVYYYD